MQQQSVAALGAHELEFLLSFQDTVVVVVVRCSHVVVDDVVVVVHRLSDP